MKNNKTSVETVRWSSDLTLIDAWQRVCVELPDQITLRAIFKATRNETASLYGVDMAVDDVKLNSGSCAGKLKTSNLVIWRLYSK